MHLRGTLLIAAIAIVAIAIIAIVLNQGAKAPAGTTSLSTIAPGATTSTGSTVSTIPEGGSGSSYMSEAEAAALMGNGAYSANENTNVAGLPGGFFSYLSSVPNADASFSGKISELWNMTYVNQSARKYITETVVKSTVASALYADLPQQRRNGQRYWNVTNQTYNGMTYSYSESTFNNATSVIIAGYKNDEMTMAIGSARGLNVALLIHTIAGDMQ